MAWGKAGFYEEAISEAEPAIGLGKEHHEQYPVAANAIVGSFNGLGKYVEAAERGEQLLLNTPKSFNGRALPNCI